MNFIDKSEKTYNYPHLYVSSKIYSFPTVIVDKYEEFSLPTQRFSLLDLLRLAICFPFVCCIISLSSIDSNLELHVNRSIGFSTKNFLFNNFISKFQNLRYFHFIILIPFILVLFSSIGFILFFSAIAFIFLLLLLMSFHHSVTRNTFSFTIELMKLNNLVNHCESVIKIYRSQLHPFADKDFPEFHEVVSTFELFSHDFEALLTKLTSEIQQKLSRFDECFKNDLVLINAHLKYLISISGLKPGEIEKLDSLNTNKEVLIAKKIKNYNFYISKLIFSLSIAFICCVFEKFSIISYLKFSYFYYKNLLSILKLVRETSEHLTLAYTHTFKSVYKNLTDRYTEIATSGFSKQFSDFSDVELAFITCAFLAKKLKRRKPSLISDTTVLKLIDITSTIRLSLSSIEEKCRNNIEKEKNKHRSRIRCVPSVRLCFSRTSSEYIKEPPKREYSSSLTIHKTDEQSDFKIQLRKLQASQASIVRSISSDIS